MQYKYIAALIASLSISAVLAGPVAMPFGDVSPPPHPPPSTHRLTRISSQIDHALAIRAEAGLQAQAAQQAHAAQAGTLTSAGSQTAQQRLDAAHAQYANVKQWLPYYIDDYCCYPGTLSYNFDYAFNFGFCGFCGSCLVTDKGWQVYESRDRGMKGWREGRNSCVANININIDDP
ncbi:hypothetical protein M409DRAFT_57555 [Zasmidium cellare ATCC 36951]|uniref:Uncharacterized protein n=1 Tax=Zasmidium cellare ATCC 36951 TaxID=1080233 RepID=A0A6A6C899_ZASCE|nr:uncharacterized protein M409DRAFT_57555 [Zasmidium cellare ATCC 36951]KAF2163261.1 hypothetical protein M409DRAFT_57555 [Zasmidium cellare ATCC 36951]